MPARKESMQALYAQCLGPSCVREEGTSMLTWGPQPRTADKQ